MILHCYTVLLLSFVLRIKLLAVTLIAASILIKCNSFGNSSFGVAGPRVWNSLPSYLHQNISHEQLKQFLKKILFGR